MVLRRHRLLKPEHVVGLQMPAHADCGVGVIGVVAVHQERGFETHCCSDGRDPLCVRFNGEQTHLDLEHGETVVHVAACLVGQHREGGAMVHHILGAVVTARGIGMNAVAKSAAEECVDGHTQGLPHDVPQGNIKRANCFDVSSLLPKITRCRVHLFPQTGGLAWILAKQLRRQHGVDAGSNRFGRAILSALAPPTQPRIGFHTNEKAVSLRESALRRIETLITKCNTKNERLNCGDFHEGLHPVWPRHL